MSTLAIQALHTPSFRVVARPAAKVRMPRIDLSRHAPLTDTATGAAVRLGLALVPFTALAWLFVAF